MTTRFKRFWEFYLAYYALNGVVILYDFFTGQGEVSTLSLVELLVLLVGAYGLYGFIYRKQLMTKLFWQIFCVPFAATLGYSFINLITADYEQYFSAFVVAVLIGLLLIVPFTYAMVKYAYFSNRIWLSGT